MNVNPLMIRKVILMALGGAAGGFIGYMASGLVIYKMNEREAKIEETFKVEEDCEDNRPDLEGLGTPVVPLTPDQNVSNGPTDYGRFSKKTSAEVLEELASKYKSTLGPNAQPEKEEEKDPKPFVIDFDEYIQNQAFKKQLWSCYIDGEEIVYADSDEQQVRDFADYIGTDVISNFGQKSGDPNIVYIRNPSIGQDFEIQRIEGSYRELILGEPVEKKEKEIKKEEKQEEEESEKKPRPASRRTVVRRPNSRHEPND